jgi:hypothetical protein
MRVDLKKIKAAQDVIDYFNTLDLKSIEFFENNKQINVPIKFIERYKLTGLNNRDFVLMGIYKDGIE